MPYRYFYLVLASSIAIISVMAANVASRATIETADATASEPLLHIETIVDAVLKML